MSQTKLLCELESLVQYYEGRITEMEEERALAVQQAVDESVSLKLKKLQVRLEKMEKENQDLKEVPFTYILELTFLSFN